MAVRIRTVCLVVAVLATTTFELTFASMLPTDDPALGGSVLLGMQSIYDWVGTSSKDTESQETLLQTGGAGGSGVDLAADSSVVYSALGGLASLFSFGSTKPTTKQHAATLEEQALVAEPIRSECRVDCHWKGQCAVGGRCGCFRGWEGELCNETVPICPENCRGHGLCVRRSPRNVTCQCFTGYAGPSCGRVVPKCPNMCSGHGKCHLETGKCICSVGFTGEDCSDVVAGICPHNCSLHGSCLLGKCQCDLGFEGVACERVSEEGCPNHCSAHGQCVRGKCLCEPGFAGEDCSDTELLKPTGAYGCPAQCSGRGVCVRGYCNCSYGWYGDKCDMAYGGCPGKCSGHGTCGPDEKCECMPGFVGAACDRNVGFDCPANCNGLGSCFVDVTFGSVGADSVCRCYEPSRVTGPSCTQPVQLGPACANNCSGHGKCTHGKCECDGEFEGPACDQPRFDCPGNCTGKGVCFDGSCSCTRGWAGRLCTEQVTLCPGDCSGHGTCDDNGNCACLSMFGGIDCTQTCVDPLCGGRGQCRHGVCACDEGFSGERCQLVGVCPNDCNGKGSCVDNECVCDEGYAGDDCSFPEGVELGELPTCEQLHNCSGHGRCQWNTHGTGPEECVCVEGWFGNTCAERVPGWPVDTRCEEPAEGSGASSSSSSSSRHTVEEMVAVQLSQAHRRAAAAAALVPGRSDDAE